MRHDPTLAARPRLWHTVIVGRGGGPRRRGAFCQSRENSANFRSSSGPPALKYERVASQMSAASSRASRASAPPRLRASAPGEAPRGEARGAGKQFLRSAAGDRRQGSTAHVANGWRMIAPVKTRALVALSSGCSALSGAHCASIHAQRIREGPSAGEDTILGCKGAGPTSSWANWTIFE